MSQNSQENTCARVSFLITLLKKRLWQRCFPVNFVKYLRTPFFIEHLWWLVLLFFYWKEVNKKLQDSFCKMEYCKAENMAENFFWEKLLGIGQVINM